MSIYTRLVANAIFPLQERFKRHTTVAVRRELEKTQWWPIERLRDLQLARLRQLLQQAQLQKVLHSLCFSVSLLQLSSSLQWFSTHSLSLQGRETMPAK